MSGHSKWSTIKHKKGVADARRGQLFTKLSREITVAAREGSDDPDMNFRLRLAIDNAKSQNMPKDTIERAVAKGSGKSSDGSVLEELTYEGYGPGGAGIIIQTVTDNRRRATSEIRSKMTRSGGNLAANGAVSWNFEQKGLVTLAADGSDPEEVALSVMDIGAEDVDLDGEMISVTFPFDQFARAKGELESQDDVKVEQAELAMIPNSTVDMDRQQAVQTLRLLDELESLDDVTKVFTNADFPDEVLAEYAGDS